MLCLQEFWACPYFFCTREREWCEFAESAEQGPSTRLCRELARRHNMVRAACRGGACRCAPRAASVSLPLGPHFWPLIRLRRSEHLTCRLGGRVQPRGLQRAFERDLARGRP